MDSSLVIFLGSVHAFCIIHKDDVYLTYSLVGTTLLTIQITICNNDRLEVIFLLRNMGSNDITEKSSWHKLRCKSRLFLKSDPPVFQSS